MSDDRCPFCQHKLARPLTARAAVAATAAASFAADADATAVANADTMYEIVDDEALEEPGRGTANEIAAYLDGVAEDLNSNFAHMQSDIEAVAAALRAGKFEDAMNAPLQRAMIKIRVLL